LTLKENDMTDRDSLGDRMKDYERISKTTLARRTYTIIRADGRAFHTYLKGAAKPYDFQFMDDMSQVAKALCEEVSGTVFAYHQSDEISLLVTDFASASTQPWFGGEVQKIVSTVAAVATAALIRARGWDRMPTFDARVFTISDPAEVANYFIWRQRDAVRNSISMAAQAQFSHKSLHGVNTGQMQERLWAEKGINWNDYPAGAKRGRVLVKEGGEREVTFTHKRTNEEQTVTAFRTWWEAQEAPHFTIPGLLASTIPLMPQLAAA
jgi:tRNA(His) guanylyltransferase